VKPDDGGCGLHENTEQPLLAEGMPANKGACLPQGMLANQEAVLAGRCCLSEAEYEWIHAAVPETLKNYQHN